MGVRADGENVIIVFLYADDTVFYTKMKEDSRILLKIYQGIIKLNKIKKLIKSNGM